MGTKKKKAAINAQQKQPDQTHDQDQEAAHQVAEVTVEEKGESEVQPAPAPETKPEAKVQPEPKPEPEPEPQPVTLESLHEELQSLKAMVLELQSTATKRRNPVKSNGKIRIRDKKTGVVYPSKNNVYQSLLKAGELKELVDKGVFGDQPEKNSFGCYALFREWPDRFEEVKEEEPTQAEQKS